MRPCSQRFGRQKGVLARHKLFSLPQTIWGDTRFLILRRAGGILVPQTTFQGLAHALEEGLSATTGRT